MKKYFKAAKFHYPQSVKGPGFLEVVNGKFGELFTEEPKDGEIVDLGNVRIAPGLVDTHIHGFLGADVNDQKPEEIWGTMSEGLLSAGVTSFLPTAVTASHADLLAIANSLGKGAKKAKGAKIRGLFFEGPYFTETHKGAQNEKYMRDPSVSEILEYQEATGGTPLKIGLAPERKRAADFIREAEKNQIRIALGHSDANYEETRDAVEAGARIFIHAFNGMRGFGHREPGMLGAVMDLNGAYAELICDGLHVRTEAIRILIREKGFENIVLVTDSMRAAGLGEGEYFLGEFPVVVKDGTARLKEGGNLAGSVLLLKDAVKNLVNWELASPSEALQMASLNPAKSMRIEESCGQIQKGADADFIVLDARMNLQATYLDGICRYQI